MYTLQEYGHLFKELELHKMIVEDGDFHLTLVKESAVPVRAEKPGETIVGEQAYAAPEEEKHSGYKEIKAPLLGMLSLGSEDEVPKVGDKVKKGDILCSIEAMKMLNNVTSDVDGTIREICVNDGTLVEYNQTLFVIE